MPASVNQKLKILYLIKILSEETDEEHGLSLQEITSKLAAYGVTADRKTLYSDMDALEKFGMEIIMEQVGRTFHYHLVTRPFQLPELKLLVDAVQSSKFITVKKSLELIKKLESLVTRREAKHLHRQVLITGRIKAMNESIYYNVDMLHDAINCNRQIKFQYYQWNINKEQVLRRSGAWYQLSPWCLIWDDENYYLVAYDGQQIKHFRVDKIIHLSKLDLPREGKQEFQEFNVAKYTKSVFGMHGGDPVRVTLEGQNEMVGTLIDRFGKDIAIIPLDDGRFRAHVNAIPSQHFLGWVISLGDGIQLVGPPQVLEDMRAVAKRIAEAYL